MSLTKVHTYTITRCGECDIHFGMPDDFYEARLNDGRTWYCPNGHSRVFKANRLAEAERRAARAEARAKAIAEQRDAARQTAKAYKGHFTRAKNQVKRAENGVCPHCNRSFQNLRDHMRSKHEEHVS